MSRRTNERLTGEEFAVARLEYALAESIKLQSHYAALLNAHDGGRRHVFASVDEWIDRLEEVAKLAIGESP